MVVLNPGGGNEQQLPLEPDAMLLTRKDDVWMLKMGTDALGWTYVTFRTAEKTT
jgi:hypothetical protein